MDKGKNEFRNYQTPSGSQVDEFYRQNHAYQTLAFARQKKKQYQHLSRTRMGVWDACELLDQLTDDSDPDTELSQLAHLLQSAEAARADGRPDWFVVTALVHDLGKILALQNEPQWAIVGDTFPLGCPFDERVIYFDYFARNPDNNIAAYQKGTGLYPAGVGLNQVTMSWGHDEYMYMVAEPYLPEPALFIIRYHSFYAAHTCGAYDTLMTPEDRALMKLVAEFSQYDLYSKADASPDVSELAPFYRNLIKRFFPDEIAW